MADLCRGGRMRHSQYVVGIGEYVVGIGVFAHHVTKVAYQLGRSPTPGLSCCGPAGPAARESRWAAGPRPTARCSSRRIITSRHHAADSIGTSVAARRRALRRPDSPAAPPRIRPATRAPRWWRATPLGCGVTNGELGGSGPGGGHFGVHRLTALRDRRGQQAQPFGAHDAVRLLEHLRGQRVGGHAAHLLHRANHLLHRANRLPAPRYQALMARSPCPLATLIRRGFAFSATGMVTRSTPSW